LDELGHHEEALEIKRKVHDLFKTNMGMHNRDTIVSALQVAMVLIKLKRFEESKHLLKDQLPVAQRVFGLDHEITLRLSAEYAQAIFCASVIKFGGRVGEGNIKMKKIGEKDFLESKAITEDTCHRMLRIYGPKHTRTQFVQKQLKIMRSVGPHMIEPELRNSREGVRSIREAVEAMTSGLDGKLVLDDATTQGHEGDA